VEWKKMDVLLDARMALRGLGISTVCDRLLDGFLAHPSASIAVWRAPGSWGVRGIAATAARSGLFDVSPRLDPRVKPFDAVHFISNIGSLLPGQNSVFTVHDLMHRRTQRSRDRLFSFLLKNSLPRAGRVVAVSGRTATEIEDIFPALKGRVEVIPHGMRRLPLAHQQREHLLAFGGGTDPRKRTDLMIAAYDRYRQTTRDPLPLIILARAGVTTTQTRELQRLGGEVVEAGTSEDVDRFMASAAALIYTTTTEGFGLPILEAAEMSTPVVMDANADVAAEVIGPHCMQVEGPHPTAWASAIRRAVEDGPVDVARFLPDWTVVAAQYLELYREVALA
jgi:glycosyltransferase involved in cell wall biosynthesis